MKIGIILSPYGEKKPSGLSRFIINLTTAIIKTAPEHTFVLFTRGLAAPTEFTIFSNVEIKNLPDNIFWKDIAFLRNKDINVWLYNNLGLPLLFNPSKSVAIALDFGNLYSFEEKTRNISLASISQKFLQSLALRKAKRVVCISQSTKDDVKKFFPKVNHKKVQVSMCGFTPLCDEVSQKSINGLPGSFYLLVGVIKPRKNQATAVKAFIKTKERGSKSHLVIAGKGEGEYFNKLMLLIQDSPYQDSIHYIGYRSDAEMATLFKNTTALIIPSIVEGFGMPVVEAMSCGTPVIISSHTSLVEAAGGAALIANTDSAESFADAMFIIADDKIRRTCIEKGLVQAQKFSWQKSAEEYMEIINNLQNES